MGIDFTGLDGLKDQKKETNNQPRTDTNTLLIKRHAENVDEVRKIYKEYQENIKMTEELRVDILKTTNKDPRITKDLFMKAIKIVSLLCHEPTFYDQIEKRVVE